MLLSNLLPGLRELRAPLAAGYTLLLAVFVGFGGHFASEKNATGVLRSLYDASDAVGKAGVLAALTFVAYMVGSVVADVAHPFFSRVGTPLGARGARSLVELANRVVGEAVAALAAVSQSPGDVPEIRTPSSRGHIDDEGITAYRGRLQATLEAVLSVEIYERPTETGFAGYGRVSTSSDTDRRAFRALGAAYGLKDATTAITEPRIGFVLPLAFATFRELDLVLVRLLGREPELHSAADRLRSEAELRQAIAPALLALGVALLVRGEWAAGAAALIAVPAVLLQASRRRREANDLLADAVALERVHAPTLERFLRLNGIESSDRAPEPAAAAKGTGASTTAAGN